MCNVYKYTRNWCWKCNKLSLMFLMVNLSLSKWGGSIVPLFNSALYQVYGQLYAPTALPPEKVHVVWSSELGWKVWQSARLLLLCSVPRSCLELTMWYSGLKYSVCRQLKKDGDKQQYPHRIWHSQTEPHTTQLIILSRFTSRKRLCPQSGRLNFPA
jgi:hypothetical protein